MSKTNEKVNAILAKFGLKAIALSEEKKQMLASANTADGMVLSTPAEAFAAGVEVYTVDADGNEVPAPAGEYAMEDGSILVVGEGGVCSEIKPMEEEVEMSEDVTKVIESLASRLAEVEAKLTASEEALAAATAKATTAEGQVTNLSKQLEVLKGKPAAPSAKDKEVQLSKEGAKSEKTYEQMSYSEKINFNMEKLRKQSAN